jgi:3-hydroxyacyl-CoA dehydrogenase
LVEGALPDQVDAAMRGFGMAMGPFEAQDMSGLDIAYANIKRQGGAGVPLVERLVEDHQRLGRKSGAGWYDYDTGGRAAASSVVADVIRATSEALHLTRRDFPADAIVESITLAMIAEACAILDEGIAGRPQDIDLVMIHGYGFPRWRGGLMHHADSLGDLLDRYAARAETDPPKGSVPPLLRRLADRGQSLASLN